jgi:hypothetical protein
MKLGPHLGFIARALERALTEPEQAHTFLHGPSWHHCYRLPALKIVSALRAARRTLLTRVEYLMVTRYGLRGSDRNEDYPEPPGFRDRPGHTIAYRHIHLALEVRRAIVTRERGAIRLGYRTDQYSPPYLQNVVEQAQWPVVNSR